MTNLEIINLLQRITGMLALGLITLQIYLGASRKAIWFHRINGILAYIFVFLHPLLLVFYDYVAFGRFDPLYVFVDVCLLCDSIRESLINLGRIAFYLITVAVIAIKFREFSSWLKTNWRKLHVLNYLAFYFVSFHSINIGTDSKSSLFLVYFWICQIIVLCSIIQKLKTLGFVAKLKNRMGL